MGKNKEETEEIVKETPSKKEAYVSLKFGGLTPHFLSYHHNQGSKRVLPGEIEKFNIYDKEQLNALLGILKQINTERGIFNTTSFKDKQDRAQPIKYRKRWEVAEGLDNLPEPLRDIKYAGTRYQTPAQRDAILSLVPDYYEKAETIVKIKR